MVALAISAGAMLSLVLLQQLPLMTFAAAGGVSTTSAAAGGVLLFGSRRHPFHHRSLLQVPSCLECSIFSTNGCLSVTLSPVDFATQTRNVTIDLSDCKDGQALSWACIQLSDVTLVDCAPQNSTRDAIKCDDATAITYTIPSNLSSLPLQVRPIYLPIYLPTYLPTYLFT